MKASDYFLQAEERKKAFGARPVVEQDFPGETPNLYRNGLFVAARGEPIKANTLVKGICFYEELTIRDLAAIAISRYYSEKGLAVQVIIPDEENKVFHHSSGKFLEFLEGFVGYFAPKANIIARSRHLEETYKQLSLTALTIPTSKILRVLKEESSDPETVTAQYRGGEYPASQVLDLLISLSDIMGPVMKDSSAKVLLVAEPPKDNYVLLARELIRAATGQPVKGEEHFHGLYHLYPPRLTRESDKFAGIKYLTIAISGEDPKENEDILRTVPKASDGMSLKEFQSKGADPLSCPVFQYSLYSDAVLKDLGVNINIPLERTKKSCMSGSITCQECKNCLMREPHNQVQEFLRSTFAGKIK